MDKEAILALIQSLAKVQLTDISGEALIVPRDRSLVDLEPYHATPRRIEGERTFQSSQSFIDYFNRFYEEESAVYLDLKSNEFVAVLDHHGLEAPRWCRHRALFSPALSSQWQAWLALHKKPAAQVAFAIHVEDSLDDILKPAPNTVLDAALKFQKNERMELVSHANLDDGDMKFNFSKNNVSLSVTFPHDITLSIPIFENEVPRSLDCRIRYRVDNNGMLLFTFSFKRDPQLIVLAAIREIATSIREGCKTDHIYEGSW